MKRGNEAGGESHRFLGSTLLATVSGLGLAFAILCIVLYQTQMYDGPWHALAIGIGVPSALALAYAALRRAWEESEDH